MQGTITLESEIEKGSTFIISIPLQIPAHKGVTIEHNFSDIKVLIFGENLKQKYQLLQHLGCKAEYTNDIKIAFQIYQNHAQKDLDLILIDNLARNTGAVNFARIVSLYESSHTILNISTKLLLTENSQKFEERKSYFPVDIQFLYRDFQEEQILGILQEIQRNKKKQQRMIENTNNKNKILIIDDDVFILQIIRTLFQEEFKMLGMQVEILIAENFQEAINQYLQNYQNISAILTDNQLNDLSGIDIIQYIRCFEKEKDIKQSEAVKIVMISGDLCLKEDAINSGAQLFFIKPFKARDCKQVINWVYEESL